MRFSKKAQSLSMQTIIIAALGLIVLGIVSWILVSQSTTQNRQFTDCAKQGGICVVEPSCEVALANYLYNPNQKYSSAREEPNLKCYSITGEVEQKRCCRFI